MPERVIFLDIDGVMNSVATRPEHRHGLVSWLDPANVAVLNQIVEATGAVIVVSSTWRLAMPFAELRANFRAAGCVAEIVDVTPDIAARERVREIVAWLARQSEPPRRYAIIDDDFYMDELPGKLVRTSKLHGLSARELPAVLALLAD
jgi:hypothetical protein